VTDWTWRAREGALPGQLPMGAYSLSPLTVVAPSL
jgi:hypothetical protein